MTVFRKPHEIHRSVIILLGKLGIYEFGRIRRIEEFRKMSHDYSRISQKVFVYTISQDLLITNSGQAAPQLRFVTYACT